MEMQRPSAQTSETTADCADQSFGSNSSTPRNMSLSDVSISETGGQKSVAEASDSARNMPNGNMTMMADQQRRGNGAAVASPKDVAERMWSLDGFDRSQVASLLAARGEDSERLGTEFMAHFNFSDSSVVDGLRSLLKHATIGGETQEQDRILRHFSKHFAKTTSKPFGSLEAVHTLCASVMLLNQDLHGENLGKRMTQAQFTANLSGLCDGHDFPKALLKDVFHQVKSKPLLFASEEEAHKKNLTTPPPSPLGKVTLPNTFIDIDLADYPNIIRRGFMKRKDPGKGIGQRHWSLRWCVIRGFLLHMFKPPSNGQEPSDPNFCDMRSALVLTHAVTRPASLYRKRLFVLELTTADRHSLLFQASSYDDLQSWILGLNLAAALHSAPPLPAPSGSSMQFQRPQLPRHPSKLSQEEQLEKHREKVDELSRDISEAHDDAPGKDKRAMAYWTRRMTYLSEELVRYQFYVEAMTRDHDLAPAAHNASLLASPTLSIRSLRVSHSTSLSSLHSSVSQYTLPPGVGSASLTNIPPSMPPPSDNSKHSAKATASSGLAQQPGPVKEPDMTYGRSPSRNSYKEAMERVSRSSESHFEEIHYV